MTNLVIILLISQGLVLAMFTVFWRRLNTHWERMDILSRRIDGLCKLNEIIINEKLPTLCILCVADPEILKEEWGHKLDKREKPIKDVCLGYRVTLNHLDLLKNG